MPTKIKIFAYLAAIDRLSTRANLFNKHCSPSASCETCGAEESGHHLFFACPAAAAVWLQLQIIAPEPDAPLWTTTSPAPAPVHVWRSVLAAVLWQIWKARNDLVFNDKFTHPSLVIRRAADDILLWTGRFKAEDRLPLNRLRALLVTRSM